MPPPPEVVTAESPERTGVRGFLDPFLPAIVTNVLVSPLYILASIVSAALDTAQGVILSVVVALIYTAYLIRRWRTPREGDEGA